MRRVLLLFLCLFSYAILQAQSTFQGRIVDGETGKAIAGASIVYGDQNVSSAADGSFQLRITTTGNTSIQVSVPNYEPLSFIPMYNAKFSLGDILLKPQTVYNAESGGLSEVSASSLDFEDEGKGQYVSGLLKSSGDVFSSTASNVLSANFFRARGYDAAYSSVYINGVQVNDPENGRPSWSEWASMPVLPI